MSDITEYNTLIEKQDEKGNVERHFPITKKENIIGIGDITGQISKLEDLTNKEKSALMLLAANSYVIDDETGKTYKIGSANGKFYFTESDVSIRDILTTITEAISSSVEVEKE